MNRLNEQIRDDMARRIAAGELEPGEILPAEGKLAEQLRVSKGVVREMTRGLEERGLISVRHGKGMHVNDPDEWDHADPLVIDVRLSGPDRDVALAEALEVELALEVQAARHGAADPLDGCVEAMVEALTIGERSAIDASADVPSMAYHDADARFHRAILDAAGNRMLTHANQRFQRVLFEEARRRVHTPADVERSLAEHHRILNAYVARDPEAAAQTVNDHLTASALRLVERPLRQR